MPLFSVIIPVYNREQYIARAVESVLQQTYSGYELIVIDDGSTDMTPQYIHTLPGSVKKIFCRNGGVSAARNTGIAAASGEYICFLDSDDAWNPRKLETHVKYLERNPESSIHQSADIWIRNEKRVNPGLRHLKPQGMIFRQSLELCCISPSSAVLRKDLFIKHGVFDEKLPACEDYDLWLRITPFHEVGLIDEGLMTRYAGHSDQLSAAFPVMDRFRVYAIIKLLGTYTLSPADEAAAAQTAVKKLTILKNGAQKRSRIERAEFYNSLIDSVTAQDYNRTDYAALLDE